MGQVIIGGGAIVGEETESISALTPAATVTVDASKGNVFTLTPGQAETLSASNVSNGEEYVLIVTAPSTTSYTLTFGTNFHANGTLATGTTANLVFVLSFVSVGGTLIETSRTTGF